MDFGKATTEFSLDITSATLAESPGDAVKINVKGTATNQGRMVGTLTIWPDDLRGDSAKVEWVGIGFPDDGESTPNVGTGYSEKSGPASWRVRMLGRGATGGMVLVEGELSLDSYTGSGYIWE